MRDGLLKSQRNDVLIAIQESRVAVDALDWTELDSRQLSDMNFGYDQVPALVCRQDPAFYFVFDEREGKPSCYFSPGEYRKTEDRFSQTWHMQLQNFRNWLVYLAREAQAPDLWAQLSTLPLEAGGESSAEDEPLTPVERRAVLDAINGVRALLEARDDVDAAQRATMAGLLGRIAKATENATRGQFSLLIWGGIASAIAAQVITPANGKWLLDALQGSILWLPSVVRALLAGH